MNDEILASLSGAPHTSGRMRVLAGNSSGVATVPTGACVHHVSIEAHGGDATIEFPTGGTLTVKNGFDKCYDMKGFMSGGAFTVTGLACNWMFSYVLPA